MLAPNIVLSTNVQCQYAQQTRGLRSSLWFGHARRNQKSICNNNPIIIAFRKCHFKWLTIGNCAQITLFTCEHHQGAQFRYCACIRATSHDPATDFTAPILLGNKAENAMNDQTGPRLARLDPHPQDG